MAPETMIPSPTEGYMRRAHVIYERTVHARSNISHRSAPHAPIIPGICIIADCPQPAMEGDVLCMEHARYYRRVCSGCGKKLVADASVERGLCWSCWRLSEEGRAWNARANRRVRALTV